MNIWEVLGIEPTKDIVIIRNAYSEKVKATHPEDNPEGFAELKDAYKAAIKRASTTQILPLLQSEENIKKPIVKKEDTNKPKIIIKSAEQSEEEEQTEEKKSVYDFSSTSGFWRQIADRDFKAGKKTTMPEILKQAYALKQEYLLKTEELFAINSSTWIADFQEHFLKICKKVKTFSMKNPIEHLQYIMLYSNFIDRNYTAEIWAFGKGWFSDKGQEYIDEYDISFFLVYFDKLWNELTLWNNSLDDKVSDQEITRFMMEALPNFYSYLKVIVRFAIVDCVDEKSFTDIVKNDKFTVRVGDYMAKQEPVFTQKKNKNADTLADWFSERLETKYVFEDCSDLDFSSRDFSNTVFRFVQFRRTVLKNANLKSCLLMGAIFYNAQLEDCCFDYCSLYQTVFTRAMLKNASFKMAQAAAGLEDPKVWKQVGFVPANFNNANLTKTNFKGANFHGASFKNAVMADSYLRYGNFSNADFSGADLSEADLSNANFEGAIFTGANLTGALLMEANLKDAVFLDVDLSKTRLDNANFTDTIIGSNFPLSAEEK